MYNFKRNILNFVGDMIFLIKIPNRLPFDVFEFGLPEGFTLRSCGFMAEFPQMFIVTFLLCYAHLAQH